MSRQHQSKTYESPRYSWQHEALRGRMIEVATGFQSLEDSAEFIDPGISTLHERPRPAERLPMWPVPAAQPSGVTMARQDQVRDIGVDRAQELVAAAHAAGPDPLAEVADQSEQATNVVDLEAFWAQQQALQQQGQEPPDVAAA